MSIAVLSWAFAHSESKLGDRLVLFALADHAKDDGTYAWPSVSTIARAAKLSERQVQRCLRNLEEMGEIELAGRSRTGTNIYSVTGFIRAQRGDNLSPLESTGGDIRDTQGVTSTTQGGDVGVTRSVRTTTVRTSTATYADSVLALWNELAGQRLRAKQWLRMIQARCDEYPELTLDDHRRLIEQLLTAKWWRTGPGTPNLLYGTAAQFERSMLFAADAKGRNAAVADQADRFRKMLGRRQAA